MPSKAKDLLVWDECGGRNGFDAPHDLPDNQACELMNVSIIGGFFEKRKGSEEQVLSGAFNGEAVMYRFVPGQSELAAELLFASHDLQIMRVAAGTTAVGLTLADAYIQNAVFTTFATLNGKCYIAYDSAVNRLHVFDPHISTSVVRRTGLALPAVPTVANSGSGGSYSATLRYYRVQWVTQVSGTLQRASNLGPSASFTPDGSHDAAVVSRPTAPSEGETHWRVWGSEDDESYFLVSLSDIAIATGSYSDTALPSAYEDNDPAPAEGFFTPFPSAKFLCSTGDRLLGFGAWATTAGDSLFPRNGRVWFTPVLDSSDYDDDERVDASLGGFIDVSRDAGSEDRGIVGPLDNQILVGQSIGLYILIATGNAEVPYRRIVLTNALGMVSHHSSFMGEDEFGRPCIYFLDPNKGPYRYGASGLQWCGWDVQDVWETVNLNAAYVVAHGWYDRETRMASWNLAVGSEDFPTSERIVFHVREGEATATEGVRNGWSRYTTPANASICSCMFSVTLGATMSRRLKPYTGYTSLYRWESDTATDDNGTAFQAYATSKAYLTDQLNRFKEIRMAYLQAEASTGTEIQLTISRDFGRTVRRFSKPLNPNGVQARVRVKYETAETVDAIALQFTVGDAAAVSNRWEIDQVMLPVDFQEEDR